MHPSEQKGFIPQGEAFAGAKQEMIGLGVSQEVLSKAEQI